LKELIEHSKTSTVTLHRDDHVEGQYYFHTQYHDDAALETNKRIRLEGLMPVGKKCPMLDNAEVAYSFSCPDGEQWALFKRDYPDVYRALMRGDQQERFKAARELSILHPAWVTMASNR